MVLGACPHESGAHPLPCTSSAEVRSNVCQLWSSQPLVELLRCRHGDFSQPPTMTRSGHYHRCAFAVHPFSCYFPGRCRLSPAEPLRVCSCARAPCSSILTRPTCPSDSPRS